MYTNLAIQRPEKKINNWKSIHNSRRYFLVKCTENTRFLQWRKFLVSKKWHFYYASNLYNFTAHFKEQYGLLKFNLMEAKSLPRISCQQQVSFQLCQQWIQIHSAVQKVAKFTKIKFDECLYQTWQATLQKIKIKKISAVITIVWCKLLF